MWTGKTNSSYRTKKLAIGVYCFMCSKTGFMDVIVSIKILDAMDVDNLIKMTVA